MLKKSLLSLAVAASLGVTGCNISSTSGNSEVETLPVEAGSPEFVQENSTSLGVAYPLFNPSKSTPIGLLEIPITSDLLFNGSPDEDGCLDLDGDAADDAGYCTEEGEGATRDGTIPLALGDADLGAEGYNPIFSAAAELDGFSTTAQIDIPFGAASGGTANLDPDSLVVSGEATNVMLIPMNYSGDPVTASTSLDEANPIKGMAAPISASIITYKSAADAAASGAGSVLRISPTTPLAPATRYIIVLTKGIKDVNGNSITTSPTYTLLSSEQDFISASDASKIALRDKIRTFENIAEAYFGAFGLNATKDDIAYAFSFSTAGTTTVLESMAAPANFVAGAVSAEAGAKFNITLPAKYRYTMESSLRGGADIETTAGVVLTAIGTDAAASPDVVEKATAQAVLDSLQKQALALGLISDSSDATAIQTAQGTLIGSMATIHSAIPSPAPRVSTFGLKDGAYDTIIMPSNGVSTSGVGSVASGTIKLPYFSGTPDLATSQLTAAYVFNGWVADDTLATDLEAVLASANVSSSAVTAPSTNVTRHFPLAKLQSWQDVPVTVVYSQAGCTSGVYKPVIFQHGITANRKSAFGVAASLLSSDPCYATVAIDMPQHGLIPTDATLMAALGETTGGQRHFGLKLDTATGQPTAMTGTGDSSGSLFIQLPSFQGTRDNTRQAVMDLLNLNASLAFMDFTGDSDADFDTSKVYFIGHSLGAMLGSNFIAVNNNVGAAAEGCATCNTMLPEITAAVLANPGGGIVKLLENSGSFGPTVIGGLAALGEQAELDLSQGSSLYELTLNIFQAVMDSADPINFAKTIADSSTPILMFEIAGDGTETNPADATVPVDALSATLPAPLSGTEPLITAMELTAYATTQDTDSALKAVVRFTEGQHSSFAGAEYDADDNATASAVVFPEMMTQVGTFLGSDGQDITITNTNIVKAAQ